MRSYASYCLKSGTCRAGRIWTNARGPHAGRALVALWRCCAGLRADRRRGRDAAHRLRPLDHRVAADHGHPPAAE